MAVLTQPLHRPHSGSTATGPPAELLAAFLHERREPGAGAVRRLNAPAAAGARQQHAHPPEPVLLLVQHDGGLHRVLHAWRRCVRVVPRGRLVLPRVVRQRLPRAEHAAASPRLRVRVRLPRRGDQRHAQPGAPRQVVLVPRHVRVLRRRVDGRARRLRHRRQGVRRLARDYLYYLVFYLLTHSSSNCCLAGRASAPTTSRSRRSWGTSR